MGNLGEEHVWPVNEKSRNPEGRRTPRSRPRRGCALSWQKDPLTRILPRHPTSMASPSQFEGTDGVFAALTSGEGVGTHVRTALYFGALLGAICVVLAAFPWSLAWRKRPVLLLALPYAGCSLLMTW